LFETALDVQLSEQSLTQTSRELLVLMVSHCFEQDSVWVFLQLVVSVTVQLLAHVS
jgi:hypothetical protein